MVEKKSIPCTFCFGDAVWKGHTIARISATLTIQDGIHAPETDDIAGLAEINAAKVYEIADKILSVCRTPIWM